RLSQPPRLPHTLTQRVKRHGHPPIVDPQLGLLDLNSTPKQLFCLSQPPRLPHTLTQRVKSLGHLRIVGPQLGLIDLNSTPKQLFRLPRPPGLPHTRPELVQRPAHLIDSCKTTRLLSPQCLSKPLLGVLVASGCLRTDSVNEKGRRHLQNASTFVGKRKLHTGADHLTQLATNIANLPVASLCYKAAPYVIEDCHLHLKAALPVIVTPL
ncbi:unnamed protein product, partial [Ectocarpus sp. 8 AP-2014]